MMSLDWWRRLWYFFLWPFGISLDFIVFGNLPITLWLGLGYFFLLIVLAYLEANVNDRFDTGLAIVLSFIAFASVGALYFSVQAGEAHLVIPVLIMFGILGISTLFYIVHRKVRGNWTYFNF